MRSPAAVSDVLRQRRVPTAPNRHATPSVPAKSNSSAQRFNAGTGSVSPPPAGVTATTTVDVHGGAVPDGAQLPSPGGVTLATFAMFDGGFASSSAVTV